MATSWDLKDLEQWDARIREKVQEFGLDCYPQEFEVCDHAQMLGYMAYSGMPSHYPHWSYGKAYEKLKTLYDYGVYGHNDFFKNNFTFRTTRAQYTLSTFKAHASRVRMYVEDPSIGIERVES